MRGNRARKHPGSPRGHVGQIVAGLVLLLALLSPMAAGAQDVDDPGDLGIGMEVFNAGCSSCHLADGTGSSAGRSLIDIAIEQPDRSVHVASVTNGLGNMPAYEGRLTEEEIDAAVSYLRLTFLSEEDPMDELPRTGTNAWLFVIGLGLVAAGGSAVLAVNERSMARLRASVEPSASSARGRQA